MTRTAEALDHQYNLIEDYAATKLPALADGITNAFVTLHNAGSDGKPSRSSTELLSASVGNALLHFFHDPSSPSGWNHEERSVDGSQNAPIDKLLGFYRGAALYALAHYSAADGTQKVIGLRKTAAGGWAGIPMEGQLASFIERMTQTDVFETEDGRVFVYGISKAVEPGIFVLIEVAETVGDWSMLHSEMIPAVGAGYRLLPGKDDSALTVMTTQGTTATFRGADVSGGTFTWADTPKVEHDLGLGLITPEQVFALPSSDGGDIFLLQQQDGSLAYISGYWGGTPQITVMTGKDGQPAAVRRVSTGCDAAGRWMVFATETGASEGQDSIWLQRQSTSAAGVAFDGWVPLGGAVSAIACPRAMSDGPEVFVYDLESKVRNLGQATASTAWFTQTMAVPETKTDAVPPEAPTYNHALTSLDANGNAVPKQVMTLTTDRPAMVSVNGVVHQVGPNTPLDVETDEIGELALHTVATGLSAPSITLAAGWLPGGKTAPLRSDKRAHERLAGRDAAHPVDGAALKQAGLLPQDAKDKTAKASAKKLKQFGKAALSVGRGTSDNTETLAFAMTFDDDGLAMTDADAGSFERDFVQTEALSIGSIFGDVVHLLKSALDKLKSIAVKVEKGLAKIVINGVEHLVHTVEGVASAIELVVMKIASAVKAVVSAIVSAIKWLMELFHWEDIIHCKQVISHYVESTIKKVAALSKTKGPAFVQKEFDTAKTEIVKAFNSLEAVFEKGASFNNSVSSSKNSAFGGGGSTLDANNLHGYRKQNSVQMNYVRNRSKGPVNEKVGGAALMGAGPTGTDDFFGQIENAISTAFDKKTQEQLQQGLKKMESFLGDIHGVKSFFDVAILELLQLVEELVLIVLSVVEAVILVILDVAADAISAVNALLIKPINIPVISWLYKKVAQHDLTILDVMCLIIAVPATLIYKVFWGGSNASPPFTATQANDLVNAPVTWPAVLQGSDDAAPVTAVSHATLYDASDTDALLKVLAVVGLAAWIEYGALDLALDGAAIGNIDDLPSILQLSAIALEVATQAIVIPSLVIEGDTETGYWLVAQWAAAFVPFILDVASFATRKRITRFNELPGQIADALSGALLLAVSVGAVVVGKKNDAVNSAGQAALILPAIPLLCKPLIQGGDNPVTAGLLAVGDLGGDWGAGIAGTVSAFE